MGRTPPDNCVQRSFVIAKGASWGTAVNVPLAALYAGPTDLAGIAAAMAVARTVIPDATLK